MCNNAVDFSDDDIKRLGIDISRELAECKKEYGVGTGFYPVGKVSRKIMDAGNSLGCEMRVMPKFTGRKNRIVKLSGTVHHPSLFSKFYFKFFGFNFWFYSVSCG